MNYRARLTAFFSQYIKANSNYGILPDGNFSNELLAAAADCLLENGTFTDKRDMKLQALRDFDVILPDWLFEKEAAE